MYGRALLVCLFLLLSLHITASSQMIRGEVIDMENKQPVSDVVINNIYTSSDIQTDQSGSFSILAANGQLLEFKKAGYKTVRVRIPNGYLPSYFKIIMQQGVAQVPDAYAARTNRYDYTRDSIRYHDLYKHELDFARMSTLDMIQHPFSALSKHNREIWQFQDDYTAFEKEKYVDKTFNADIITKFTGLKGDSLNYFMRRYRPTYDQLRPMNDYTFFSFIKRSVATYRSRINPRGAR